MEQSNVLSSQQHPKHRITQSQNQTLKISQTSHSAKHPRPMQQLQQSASQSNPNQVQYYHHKKKHKKHKNALGNLGSNSHSISEQHKTPLPTNYHPQMFTASNEMTNQTHTYSFLNKNGQNYLDEISQPTIKSHKTSIAVKNANNSHRDVDQAPMSLFGQPQNDSFINVTQMTEKHILNSGTFANGAPNSKGLNHINATKSKQKKQGKKVSNVLGSISSASTAAAIGGQASNLQHSSLLNDHYAVVTTNNSSAQGVFSQKQDGLTSKTSNYYTVINQTLASQVASSMKEGSFMTKELIAQGGSQFSQRRDIMSGLAVNKDHRNAYIQSGKRKSKTGHLGLIAKSTKEHTPVNEAQHSQNEMQHSSYSANGGERVAHTSIDWKHGSKKGLGLNLQAHHIENQNDFARDFSDFTVFQESNGIFQPPKTSSGRPTTKKAAAQSIVERIQKNNLAQSVIGVVGQSSISNPQSGIRKGKQTMVGMSGRNRTATALLAGSASASSEPIQESINDGKASVLNTNQNNLKDQYQLLSQDSDTKGQHLLIAQNVIERKKRLKTSQGIKSGASGSGAQGGKLPVMHTLEHSNQIALLKNSKERSGHSNSIFSTKQQSKIFRNQSKGPIETNNVRSSQMDSFSVSDDGKQTANLTLKKPMGFVKKTRTQISNNAISQAVGITGTGFSQDAMLTVSPHLKKQKKQKSVSSATMAPPGLKHTNDNMNSSKTELSPNSNKQDQIFLPHTGIDFPFLKKRPKFIIEAPDFEQIHSGNSNFRFVASANNSIQHALVSRPSDFNARMVYDCTFGAGPNTGSVLTSGYLIQAGSGGTTMVGGQIVNGRYFDRLNQYYNLKNTADTTLVFESRFESGNLHRATQVGEWEYDLDLKFDHGSPQQLSQWFYFRVSNTRKNQAYKFNIINLVKPDSLYNNGMKPLVYSKKEADTKNIGWYRTGQEIKYFPSKKRSLAQPNTFYTLSFSFEFNHDQDQVYFAHCYPYTYSDCIMFLKRVCLPQHSKDRFRRTALCKTRAGNSVEMLIITNFAATQDQIAERKCVILSGRVHPGESNSSFVMEGLIELLLSDEREARQLRDTFVFKIIPMLNPDGVIVGNYRCSLSGLDLNRQWQNPTLKTAPEILSMKDMVKKTLECRDIHLFVDVHGHSRAKNLFMYGCQQTGANGKPLHIHDKKGLLAHKEKVLPVLQARQMDYFSFEGCSFAIQKCKETTGRVVMHREFGIINSYTLEISFCGPTQGHHKDTHFSQKLLKEMGKNFAKALVKFSEPTVYRDALREVEERINAGSA